MMTLVTLRHLNYPKTLSTYYEHRYVSGGLLKNKKIPIGIFFYRRLH
jgi:hypothetical protein